MYSEEEKKEIERFFKGAFIGTTINWLEAEMSYDLLEEGRRACEMLRNEELCKKLFAL